MDSRLLILIVLSAIIINEVNCGSMGIAEIISRFNNFILKLENTTNALMPSINIVNFHQRKPSGSAINGSATIADGIEKETEQFLQMIGITMKNNSESYVMIMPSKRRKTGHRKPNKKKKRPNRANLNKL